MLYIIILLIWLAEIVILPFCSDATSILIISSPFFITLPLVLSIMSIIPSIFVSLLSFTGVILSIIIIYQFTTELIYS